MTQVGIVYGQSLYELAQDEGLDQDILAQLRVLQESFQNEPDFLKLLGSPSLSKAQRCEILEESFRGQVHPYVLNFLKILTEKGYVRHFPHCWEAYLSCYNEKHNILPVTAVTAISLSQAQREKLMEKLGAITKKQIDLCNRVDPSVLGGIRLDYDGQRLDATVSHRMDDIREMLSKTVL